MHICLATLEYPPFTTGGIATYCSTLARMLADESHRVTVLTSCEAGVTEWTYPGVEVVRLHREAQALLTKLEKRLPIRLHTHLWPVAAGVTLHDWLLENGCLHEIDVVEAPDYSGASYFLIEAQLPALVVACHGSTGQLGLHDHQPRRRIAAAGLARELEILSLALADEVMCHSMLSVSEWTCYLGRTPRFATAPFLPMAGVVNSVERRGETLVGIAVGRLNRLKGVIDLMEALQIVAHSDCPPVRVDWIGPDAASGPNGTSMRDHLERSYPDLWGTAFRWEERADPADVRMCQAAADFAVATSTWDALNYTVLEAMSVATPVIISRGAGVSYLGIDGYNCLLIDPGKPEELATAIRTLVMDGALRKSIGLAGLKTVEREFALAKVVDEHVSVYEAAIERHRYRHSHDYGGVSADDSLAVIMAAATGQSIQASGPRLARMIVGHVEADLQVRLQRLCARLPAPLQETAHAILRSARRL